MVVTEEEGVNNGCSCIKCRKDFTYYSNEITWQEFGTYSAKTVKCPYCKCVNVIKYDDASGLNVNFDRKYYDY